MHEEQKEEAPALLNELQLAMLIPACCREGREDCPHVLRREKPKKGNVGV